MSTPTSSAADGKNDSPPAIPNSISWNELVTPDPKAAVAFYGSLFGWTAEVMPMPDKEYTMLKLGDRFFGGIVATPQPGIPTHWLHYVTVTDLEGTIAKAISLGAMLCAGPFEVGDAGRIAILRDPQGAGFGLHTGK